MMTQTKKVLILLNLVLDIMGREIQKEYNLKDVPLYSLRHTGASLLIAAGCDVKEVSGRLGHSRTSTTLDIYTHLFEKVQQHTADVMSAAIERAKKEAQ